MWAKFRVLALVVCIWMVTTISRPVAAQLPFIPSPTPIPSPTAMSVVPTQLPRSEIYNYLATAAANVNALPDDVSAPGGVPLVPDTDGAQIFGYIKWLWSGNSAQELVGETVSPLVISTFIWVTLIVVITLVFLTITLVSSILKFIVWAVRLVMGFVPGLG